MTRGEVIGTIDHVSDHRIRLTDDDMSLIVSSLRARLAMLGSTRKRAAARLIERLEDSAPGNPGQRFGWENVADLDERLDSQGRKRTATR